MTSAIFTDESVLLSPRRNSSMGGAVEVGHRPLRGRPQLRPHANEKRNDLPSMKHQFRLKTGQRFENVLKHINWH